MEEKNNKNSRAFYLTVAVVLAVVTVLIIAIVAARQSVPSPDDTNKDNGSGGLTDDTPTIDENEDVLPTFSIPVEGEIAIDFSDTVPVFSQTMNDYRTHCGIDIRCDLGKNVKAVADGTVSNIWVDPFMGTCVSIDHAGGAVSIYRNLAPEVHEGIIIGASVKSGDVIGAVGESAMNEIADEPHLHYELKVDNKHVDPKEYIKFPNNKPNDTDSNIDTGNSSTDTNE